jgi:hypothetical protein
MNSLRTAGARAKSDLQIVLFCLFFAVDEARRDPRRTASRTTAVFRIEMGSSDQFDQVFL